MNKKVLVIALLIVVIIFAIILGMFLKTKSEDNNIANSNNTTQYVPNWVNVVEGNEAGTPVDTLKFNRTKENVTIEILQDTITKEGVKILITDKNKDHYGWGEDFRVQEKVNGEWIDLEYISDNLTWIDIAYGLNADNQLTQKLDIEKYYGKLSNGTYRIVKSVYDNGYIDIYSNEFEIK